MEFLRSLLVLGIKMIDEGKCNHLSPEELSSLTATVSDMVIQPPSVGTMGACHYLKVSRTRLMELRRLKVVPEPVKRLGFKEKEYLIRDLDKAKIFIENPRT